MRRDDRGSGVRSHEGRRSTGHVHDERVGAARGDEARKLLERLVTQDQALVGAAPQLPAAVREGGDTFGPARVGQELHREADGRGLRAQCSVRLTANDDPRCRCATGAPEPKRFDEIDDAIGVAALRDERQDEVHARIT